MFQVLFSIGMYEEFS